MIKNSQGVTEIIALLLFIINHNSSEDVKVNVFSKIEKNDKRFINGETILHAWNWSLKAIKNNLEEIRKAGYTAIQISPVQGTKDDSLENEKWWVLYQPINFKIGNTQIGSREELIDLCTEAHKCGLKIIADVIVNHTASKGGGELSIYPHDKVDSILKDNPDFWHEKRNVEDWNDRWQVTHLGIGLPDLNTANEKLQDIIIDFLNDLIKCGIDGLRFDAAKHVELPCDPDGSNFWPRVIGSLINRDKLILYGEVLQSGASNYEGYSEYMALSAEGYSYWVRASVGFDSEPNLENIKEYYIPSFVKPYNLITWVESHDDYASLHGKTASLEKWQIIMAWAIIAARKDPSPLFFNRPKGREKLSGKIGEPGNDFWKNPDIVAINKFRNEMNGQDENIVNEGKRLVMIERGNKGILLINIGEAIEINWDVKLKDGIYIDEISHKEFYVIDGKLSAEVAERSIIILYRKRELEIVDYEKEIKGKIKIYFCKPMTWNNPKAYIYYDDKILNPWPGINMISEGNGIYSCYYPEDFLNINIIFTDGINQIPSIGEKGFYLSKREHKKYIDSIWVYYDK